MSGAVWDDSIAAWPLLLKETGYHIGFTWKVWSPGVPRDAPYGGVTNAYTESGKSFNKFHNRSQRCLKETKGWLTPRM
ncbi:MAG: hypothetical protein ABGX16_23290 [Pirellulales bacterium]